PERVGSVTVEDLRKDLFSEFSKIPASQDPVFVEKEHLQVYLRIRPLTSSESEFNESQDCVSVEPPDTVVLKAPRLSLTARQSEKLGPQLAQRFQFSKVFGPETTQRQIFDGTTKALVKNVLGGENSLIFTYGVTNAGKTFTFLGPESDGGILPRSLNVIFNSIVGRVYEQNNIKPHRCVDYTRLTRDQQEEDAKIKKNLLRRFKEVRYMWTVVDFICKRSSFGELDEDSLCLEEDSNVKFSVWVSFCEIYNENIHDLLDFISNTSHRRSVLRLCQDVKGNSFVKDLTWVQVNSADEAYKVLKIGRKNQSFSSTKLNSVSSRSHSIFSIRILRIEDMSVPRVQTISELSLCDLAGSERCAKTQNKGDRLKEAGNINTSLLTLGKCMNALRLSQTQSKFQQHIPFRESKLTHYLQGFFCGRGKACMIVNINQCASMYDETLNVLKFSALAQKVVVLNPKPVLSVVPKKSAREVSMMINNVDKREWTRRSTLIGWETSLEDVLEDEDDEEMDVDEEEEEESAEESMAEKTVLEAAEDEQLELKEELAKEQSEKLAIESRIREEVTTEFMELFSNMEKDYNERLQREKEIAEERAERRLEILKNLVNKNDTETATTTSAEEGNKV
ncbi:kinesin-like protein KIF20B isoform X3, partial [Silurus meridionalis]